MQTYCLEENGNAIRCLLCQACSHNHYDIAERYCGKCHMFHEHAAILLDMFAEDMRKLTQQYKHST